MTEDIKQRVTIDAAEGIRNLENLSRKERGLANATDKAGNAADKATTKMTRRGRVVASLAGAVSKLAVSWLAFAAAGKAAVQVFRDLTAAAKESLGAVVAVGSAVRGLSANIGGKQAAQVFRDVTAISAQSGFNVQGRAQLLQAVSSATDIREGLSREQIGQLASQLALLQRGTGLGGAEAFKTVQTIGANLNLNDDQAVDLAASLVSRGIDASAVRDIVERGGTVGGVDALALLTAARTQGLDANRAGRALPTLIGALGKRDEQGNLAPELQALGLSGDQNFIERLESLTKARNEGRINEGQFFRAVGGEQNARIAIPLAKVLSTPGALTSARSAILDPNAAESLVTSVTDNPFVQSQERANLRELLVQTQRESGFGLRQAEAAAQFDAVLTDRNILSRVAGRSVQFGQSFNPPDPELLRQINLDRIEGLVGADQFGPAGGGTVVVNNIGQQFNTLDPATDVLSKEDIP